MAKYPFLSEPWIEAAKAIRDRHRDQLPPPVDSIRMNQVVTEVPFGEGVLHTHLLALDGEIELDIGELERADVTITLDYDTARSLLVGTDPPAALEAFLAGKIKVDGDVTKLLELQPVLLGQGDPAAAAVAKQIQEITE